MRLARIEGWACRSPISLPVATSFGTMRDWLAVFLRLEDGEGVFGWGEIFANWPAAGAEHRVNLLVDDIWPLLRSLKVDDPPTVFGTLTRQTRIRALQCGEPGPFAQCIAGIDIALWALAAHRQHLPLARMPVPQPRDSVPPYASGIPIGSAEAAFDAARARGFAAFKVKVGFDLDVDASAEIASGMAPGERLFADANQAWHLSQAGRFLDLLQTTAPSWLEEPIPADAPAADRASPGGPRCAACGRGKHLRGDCICKFDL